MSDSSIPGARLFRLCFVCSLLSLASAMHSSALAEDNATVRIGWVGAMSGAVAKYGAYEAATLAAEDINNTGGIAGRKLELRFQDAKCNGRDALTAMSQLTNIEKVKFIVGGHCSTESLAIAPLAERSKTIMVAAITSSPKLSDAGDYIFRVTAPNIEGAKLLLEHANAKHLKRLGVVYEETEYAQGLAEYVKSESSAYGLEVVAFDGFAPGETDLRTLVTRLKSAAVDAIYFSPQAADGSITFLKSAREQQLSVPILGNEIAGNSVKAIKDAASLFDGIIFAEPQFDTRAPALVDFEKRYKERFHVPALPYGFYTCEAYDAVSILADTIAKCGDDPQAVKKCLYEISDYQGLSGKIAFNAKGDGIRHYVKKQVKDGAIQPFE